MSRNVLLRLLATISFAGTIVINVLANSLPINGLNTGEVSDLYPSLFTPAGLTFSIWSVIYFLLAGFIVLIWNRRGDDSITALLPWFIITCVLNMLWILAWHHLLPGISVGIMLCLLGILVHIFKQLHIAKDINQGPFDRKTMIWLVTPFTIYLAWICVATIANISAFLVSVDWQGGFFSPQTWTIIMMCAASAIAVKVTHDFKNPFFSLVVFWAILGIYLRWRGSDYTTIIYGSIILMFIMVLGLIYSMPRRKTAS